MPSLHRIKTIALYAYFHLTHSMETWVDLLWFPVVEILVFGLLASFIDGKSGEVTRLVLFGFMMWEVVRTVQYSVTVGALWDIWSKNFSTLFVTPLKISEFVIGQALAGVVKAMLMLILLSVISFFLYHFSILVLGPMLLVHFFLLTIFSASAGIFTLALIIRFGTDIQSLSWSLIYIFQPISAVIYPVSVLPENIRFIAFLSPITYAMEAARQQMATGQINRLYILLSLLINLIYLFLSSVFLWIVKRQAQKSGAFARMET